MEINHLSILSLNCFYYFLVYFKGIFFALLSVRFNLMYGKGPNWPLVRSESTNEKVQIFSKSPPFYIYAMRMFSHKLVRFKITYGKGPI